MRALIIDDTFKQALASLKEYAEQHPITISDTFIPGDHPEYVRHLQMGYTAVFTHTKAAAIFTDGENDTPVNLRQLSVSVDTPGKLPSIVSVEVIMAHLGFKPLCDGQAFGDYEEFAPNHTAISIAEIIEP